MGYQQKQHKFQVTMELNKQYQDQLPNQNTLSYWNKRIWELFNQMH